ncbi:MAG: MFS transporter [Bacteroidetes bacterium]|nr:MFS transporter [Bacteroidota bacterium]MBU2506370.1 MFS transporter [Bacteroidota bacterium]
MKNSKPTSRNAWAWVPSLYYAEGIPYVVVMTVAVIMYKRMGISNTDIALYTSWLYLPWVIKPLWSPIVEIFRTKRFWIITMQLIIGAALAGVALTIPLPNFFQYTLAFLWLLAFSSATHDIAADGFYMLGLSKHDQAFFVGIRSTFYRVAMITGQGLLIILAGYFESSTGLPTVDVTVNAKPNYENAQMVSPNFMNIAELDGEHRVIVIPSELNISPQAVTKATTDSIKRFAKESNIKNGFYADETNTLANQKQEEASLNWLEQFLKNNFGQKKKAISNANETGNVGVMYFHLSKAPKGKEAIVVSFGRESGDKNIDLAEGTRFTFNSSNWNKPAMAVVQLDPKLRMEATTYFQARAGNIPLSWIITFIVMTALFMVFFVYHKFILPYPTTDGSVKKSDSKNLFKEFFTTFALFFKRKNILLIIGFLLLYRLGESQLVKLAAPFLLDAREIGGLGLTTGEVGLVYGTIGIIGLTLGGILGGFLAARNGLKYWLWWMLIAINLPNTVYVYLSFAQPESFFLINLCVAIEQFGYGFGFTAYMLYMIYVSDGDYKTAHFAITTAFMALGMMIPGMFSGWLQEIIGYQNFFVWVVIATIPAFIITKFIKIDSDFGKKTETA